MASGKKIVNDRKACLVPRSVARLCDSMVAFHVHKTRLMPIGFFRAARNLITVQVIIIDSRQAPRKLSKGTLILLCAFSWFCF